MTFSRIATRGAAVLGAAALLALVFSLPPRPTRLDPPAWQPAGTVIRGAYHIHTVRSDGSGTVDEVAAAAARAGLHFVVLTDHGDATRPPEAPAYRHGVLCIDAVEISTTGGHYVAIGLPQAPYPLGGEPRDVVEDVARLGGFGIAAHPDSARADLRWGGWSEPFDGIEWLNADSAWRDVSFRRLLLAGLAYPVRGPEALASLLVRRDGLDRFDTVAARDRQLLVLAGNDIHSRIQLRNQSDPYEGWTVARWPTYEDSFRSFSLHLTVPSPLSRRASDDASMVVGALRAGHVHTVVDGWAAPGAFEFTAHLAGRTWTEGDEVVSRHEPVALRIRANARDGRRLVLFRDGKEVDRVATAEMLYVTDRPGTYRAEAWLHDVKGGRAFPWVTSNPIRIVQPPREAESVPPAGVRVDEGIAVAEVGPLAGWQTERDPRSAASLRTDGDGVTLDFQLAGGRAAAQYAALEHSVAIPTQARRLALRIVASHPMRVSIQLRVPHGREGERWQRSVYVDTTARPVMVPLESFTPAGPTRGPAPRPDAVRSLLVVADTTHTAPGSAGAVTLSAVRFVR